MTLRWLYGALKQRCSNLVTETVLGTKIVSGNNKCNAAPFYIMVFLTMCTPVSLMDRNSWSQIKVVQPKEKNLRKFRQQKNFSEIRSHLDKERVGDHHAKRQKMTFLVSENSQWGRLGIKNCKITSRNTRKHGKKVGEGSREKVLCNRQEKVQSTFYNKIIKSRLTSFLRLKDLFSKLLSLDLNWRKPREVPFKNQRWSLRG